MSELKVYHCNEWHNEYTEFYIKSEADKVITDLEESHKKEVGQLLILNREQANAANRLRDSMEQALRHHKRKRCLAMAKLCHWKIGVFIYKEEKSNFYHRWHKRWSMLAEKFKEAK